MKTLIRVEEICFAPLDEDYRGPGRLSSVVISYQVLKETPCGYWIKVGDRKWVSKTSTKRFAYPTLDEAWTSFQARKKRQIKIYEARLDQARRCLLLPKPSIALIRRSDSFS